MHYDLYNSVDSIVRLTTEYKLSSTDFLVMRVIALHENADILDLIKDGKIMADSPGAQKAWTWIDEETIAHECGRGLRTVHRSLKDLKNGGFIDVKSRGFNRYGHPLSFYRRINRSKHAAMLERLTDFNKDWKDARDAKRKAKYAEKIDVAPETGEELDDDWRDQPYFQSDRSEERAA